MTSFVDRVTLHVAGGNGGHGVASVHREKFKPLGGPDGGNGGDGGDVVLVVDPQTTTLLDYHHSPHRRATSGKGGQGSNRNGANGEDLVLPVPDGTVVKTASGQVLADLVGNGTRFVAAAGGRGGLGNAALASPRRKAPGFALLGEPGEVLDLVLELKTVADVALVGYPSAGKSSLVAALSAARPKIADYPFTTLVPNLGVVEAGDARYTIADVPGLIPGASQGKGLGLAGPPRGAGGGGGVGVGFPPHGGGCPGPPPLPGRAPPEPGPPPHRPPPLLGGGFSPFGGAPGIAPPPQTPRPRPPKKGGR